MASLRVEDIDPFLIEKLKSRSVQHGRSLNNELITILEQAVEANPIGEEAARSSAREKLELAQARFLGRSFSDSTELVREDRQR